MFNRLTSAQNLSKLAFALAIVALLASLVDPAALWQLLANISLPLFALVIVIALADVVFMGLKWNILLKAFDVSVSNTATVLAYLRSRVFVYAAPSTLGVDAYKVYFLRKYFTCAVTPVASSIVIERVLGVLSSLGIPLLLLWFALQPLDIGSPLWITLAGFAGTLGLLLFIHLIIRYSSRLAGLSLPGFLPARIKQLIGQLSANFSKIEGKQGALWRYFLLSVLEKLGYGCAIYVSALAIGLHDVNYAYIIAATPILALLERLPISFSTIGIREGVFVVLFSPFYGDPTIAISIALTLRCAELTQIMLFSFIWFMEHGDVAVEEELEDTVRTELLLLKS